MKIVYKNKKIKIPVVRANTWNLFRGLMFRRREKAEAILFHFKNIRIHSFFVFFNFLAIWLDDNFKVVKIKVVKPFSFAVSSEKPSRYLVEIPINKKYSEILKSLDGQKV